MTELLTEGLERSRQLLADGATEAGFVASTADRHYGSVWARDACVAALGAIATKDVALVAATAATIDTLVGHMTKRGHVPALVRPSGAWDFAEGGVVDANPWLVIVIARYVHATNDVEAGRRWWPHVQAAMEWLAHQDVTGSGLVSAAPSTDWMDAALTRSGRTLHINVLYGWAALEAERLAQALGSVPPVDAAALVEAIDAWFWPTADRDVRDLYPHGFAHDALRVAYWEAASHDRRHYVSHIVHAAVVDRCDVLASCLAVVSGVTPPEKRDTLLDHLWATDVVFPYPSRTFPDPVLGNDGTGMLVTAAESNIPPRWRNRPGNYHNGAVWPYVGAFHAAAEARAGRADKAIRILEDVVRANELDGWSFPEWIDLEGNPHGARMQVWNAGALLFAAKMMGAGDGS